MGHWRRQGRRPASRRSSAWSGCRMPGEQQIAQGLISNDIDFTTGIQVDRSRRSSRATRRSPPTAARSRRTATWTGGRPRSTSTREAAVRQPGLPLGDQLLDRPQISSSTSAGAARPSLSPLPMPSLPGPQAVLRRGQAAAREVPDQRVQPGQGRTRCCRSSAGRRAATACT